MEIGGFFPYEDAVTQKHDYMSLVCPDYDDSRHLMSGRCAIYFCLKDCMLTDKKRVAYLPAYTCETVISCFIKANYKIYYYDVDENLVPQFEDTMIENISFFLICGYYGFNTFDLGFVKRCRQKGVTVMQDLTHTAFSPIGACPETDYVAVSLRKWMGVTSGGLAIKRKGTFGILAIPSHQEHLKIRDRALHCRLMYEKTGDEQLKKEGYDAFWEAEWMLRDVFDIQEGDPTSLHMISHYPLAQAIQKRRSNYAFVLEHLPQNPAIRPVFLMLPEDTCPMFFPFICENRKAVIERLEGEGIAPKVYWSVPPFMFIKDYPGAQYIYDHIMSISCDQRFTAADMRKVVHTLASLSTNKK